MENLKVLVQLLVVWKFYGMQMESKAVAPISEKSARNGGRSNFSFM